MLLYEALCSISGEGPGSKSKDFQDPAANLTPVGPEYDTQPLSTQEIK